MLPVRNKITIRMHRAGITLTEWCERNGFRINTVSQLLSPKIGKYQGKNGEVGRQIYKALIRDGYVRATKKLIKELGGDGAVSKA